MEDYKNLCARIPSELHAKVRSKQEESEQTLNQYIAALLIEYYNMKERTPMTEGTKTLAVQIPEELFDRLKVHLKSKGQSQKAFIIEMLEQALSETK